MRLFWEVARRGFRRWSTYRGATVAGVFTNTVFGFIQAYVFVAVYRHRAEVGGFDLTDAITFTFVAQGFLMTAAVFNWQEIAVRISSGDIVTDLYRPLDFQLYWLAQDLGRAAFHAIFRGIPPFLVGALVFEMRLADSPLSWAAFLISLFLAVVVSFGLRFIANLTAFWLLDIRGPLQTLMVVWLFFGGFVLPITFFPPWLAAAARATPFAAVVQLPVEIAIGKHRGAALVLVLLAQAAWAAVLLLAGRATLAAATRKVVVQGG